MTEVQSLIPPSMWRHLERIPIDRPVAMLLRHSVRDQIPPGDVGYNIPITDIGHGLARELGACLLGRLRSLHSSPLPRCLQTAEAIAGGAGAELVITPDRLLGDPGVYVLDGSRAWMNWEELGHEGVMRHLVKEATALSGMARPDEAARFLVQTMLGTATNRPGVHIFVTHDSLVTATAARLLGEPLGLEEWPEFLEGAFFWAEEDGVHTIYQDREAVLTGPLCSLADGDVIECARREIAGTVGLDTGAHFFLAGGAFKSLLTGRPPRDIDVWAATEHDRSLVIDSLLSRGARIACSGPFADAFELAGRVIDIPHNTESDTLSKLLACFDIGLSAVGVEHRADGTWSSLVHPLAIESVRRREVRLLKPLANSKYALTTLERMRQYARELGFAVSPEEEAEVWRVFEDQAGDLRAEMVERFRRTSSGGYGVMEEVACRFP
ncbi:histidine phosphatase family protein [Halomonas sp. 25-S5]|uniref:histidine phosphatase family protein n=1 Tax=Halomonas sp. 25-S5 TaxID=2994065 RepID=UPI002469622F|nr:histidine phosphatase family protein [Halomonas sp. 25-S5]